MTADLAARIETLAGWLAEAGYPVFFTGAGLSTDSGLRDYRGPDGLWTRQAKGLSTPVTDWKTAQPNAGHEAIHGLYRLGRVRFLISQNIDNLHILSGIPQDIIAELHGNVARLRCQVCEKTVARDGGSIECNCGAELISSVIDFGMSLPQQDMAEAFYHSERADLFVVVGSSLVVTPAANMPGVALRSGARLVIINQGETPYDAEAGLRFWEGIGEVLPPAVTRLAEVVGERP